MQMYYTYVLYDGDKFYIGFSKNINQRVKEHRWGKVHTTKRYNRDQLCLIYYEAFISEEDARRREKYLKTSKGRKMLKLKLKETLSQN